MPFYNLLSFTLLNFQDMLFKTLFFSNNRYSYFLKQIHTGDTEKIKHKEEYKYYPNSHQQKAILGSMWRIILFVSLNVDE